GINDELRPVIEIGILNRDASRADQVEVGIMRILKRCIPGGAAPRVNAHGRAILHANGSAAPSGIVFLVNPDDAAISRVVNLEGIDVSRRRGGAKRTLSG